MQHRNITRKTGISALLLCAALIICAPAAQALPVVLNLSGISYPEFISAEATLNYDGISKLTVDIKNTATADEGSLTGFAFNLPTGVTGVTSFTGPNGWSKSFSLDGINTPQNVGLFDVAGLTGPNFNGGKVAKGVPLGGTFSFSFVFSGTGLDLLTTEDFASLLSVNGSPNLESPFAVRFQGVDIPGVVEGGSDVAVVPIPGALWLLGSGLVGLLALRRKS